VENWERLERKHCKVFLLWQQGYINCELGTEQFMIGYFYQQPAKVRWKKHRNKPSASTYMLFATVFSTLNFSSF
jgi:hypothetical protein